ncbi:MAG: hypothetical protein COA78_21780 [Blastopirellula sp.]|nr:MAG: hypothetical protein COA78_21780 [Blastopirellula sp.]
MSDFHFTQRIVRLSTVIAVITFVPSIGRSQELTPTEAQAIAREAYIYGFPIVENYQLMHAMAIDTDGEKYAAPFNVLKHRNHIFTPADVQIVTPNVDTPYSSVWMDLRAEPLVLSVPGIKDARYYSIQLIDLYKFTFEYIGSRTTGNNAGLYLITGPNWKGKIPENINKVIRCETDFSMAIYRTQMRDPEDIEKVKNIQSQYTLQKFSSYLNQANPEPPAKINFPRPNAETESDLLFFSTLSFVLKFCPPHASEQELMGRLTRIGVVAGTPFNTSGLNPETLAAMKRGVDEGKAAISAATSTLKVAEVIGTREYLKNDYMKRAVAAKLGRYSNSKEEALYPLYLSDAEGKPLDASDTNYILKLSQAELPPVNAFWSITMYDSKSKGLVSNPIKQYRISSSILPNFIRNKDGGLTFLIQHERPSEEKLPNWLPAPKGPFYMVMRLYWPKPEAYDGTWTPPLVWQADSAPPSTISKPAGAEGTEEVKPSILVDEAKPEMERPTIWGEPTEVQIAIYVIDVDDVNSADQSFAASVYYEARWKNPLLRHKGPGPMHRNVSDIWNPRLMIIGQQMAWKSYPESVDIHPDGTVIYRQKVWGRFSQPLKLQDFPFDQQELSIQIVAAGISEDHVKMVPLVNDFGRSSSIAAKFSLPDFDVVSWNAAPSPYYPIPNEVGVAGYEMRIKVARQATYFILKVIIPLCLIVIMSWLPRWIDPEQTGTNIGISTSSFLTLVAYLFAITVLLPRVSYVTRIDRFILISTLTVFAGLIQTVANTVLIHDEKKILVERMDRWSRLVYPILLLLVLVISFVF